MAVGLTMGITVDDAAVRRLFKLAPEATVRTIKNLVESGAIDVQREMRIAAPVGIGGGSGLRGSIRYTLNLTGAEARIEPNVPYAAAVENGSRPHWVSVKTGTPLQRWAKLKGIEPYAVQRSIARKGTKAHPFVEPTYNKMKPRVLRDVAAGITALARGLDDGRV